MSSVSISYDVLESAVQQVIECEGDNPSTERLSTLLRYAEEYEQSVNVCAEDLACIESYL